MANEYSVTMYMVGKQEEIVHLHDCIKDWLSKAEGFTPIYKGLVYILKGANLSGDDFPYRGYVVDMEEPSPTEGEDWEFKIDYESAWQPCNAFWQAVINKIAPHCKMYWYGEEEGCEYFKTNDRDKLYFDWDYVVVTDSLKPSNPLAKVLPSDDYLYLTEQELRDKLGALFGKHPVTELIAMAENVPLSDDESLKIHEVTYVEN